MRIFQRKRSFLSEPAWRHEPFQDPSAYTDPFVRLMNIISNIPSILEHAEVVYGSVESPSYASSLGPSSSAAQLWDRIAEVEAHLQRWESDMVHSHEGSPTEAQFTTTPWRIPPQGDYYGPTLEPATTLCVYYSARLLLAHVDRRPTPASPVSPGPSPVQQQQKGKQARRGNTPGGRSTSTESSATGSTPPSSTQVLRWAVSICHVAADRAPHVKDAITAVVYLFTLRVAYFSFPELSNGRKWVEGLFDNVAQRFGLPLARSILTHLPGPEGPALQEFTG